MNLIDEKFRETVWNSTIPVKIDMAIEDINDVEKPPSLYFNIPRIGYIANIIIEIKTNFEKYLPPNALIEDIWFEINKTPLKWQLPFGVLTDTIFSGDNYEVPIHIIAHFRSFPENQLIRYKGRETLKFNFMNSIKEANTIKFGSSKEVLNLSTIETMKLYDIVFSNGKKMFREFWEVNKKMEGDLNNIETLKKIPIKIIFNKTEVILNKPFVLHSEKENSVSFYETYSFENYLIDSLTLETYQLIKEKMKIIIHGVELDLNFPLLFVYFNFAYMDNYLYITLASKHK